MTKNNNFINILKGVFISLMLTLILLLIFAIVLTYSTVREDTMGPVIIIVTALSLILGSSIANMKINKNGIFNGLLIGTIYLMIIYIASSIINNQFMITGTSLIMIICGAIAGMIGGIIGVNKK